jgi:hypothetical protein
MLMLESDVLNAVEIEVAIILARSKDRGIRGEAAMKETGRSGSRRQRGAGCRVKTMDNKFPEATAADPVTKIASQSAPST